MQTITREFLERLRYTDRLLREEVLGSCIVRCHGYMRFREAMALARKSQPPSPTKPSCPIARRFRDAVASALSTSPIDVAIYTGVETPLPEIHSVDGWFEFNGSAVTFKVTKNPLTPRSQAHVLVHMNNVDASFERAAMQVADTFNGRGCANAIFI